MRPSQKTVNADCNVGRAGKVVYTLKTPYRDGTTQVDFDGAAIRIEIPQGTFS